MIAKTNPTTGIFYVHNGSHWKFLLCCRFQGDIWLKEDFIYMYIHKPYAYENYNIPNKKHYIYARKLKRERPRKLSQRQERNIIIEKMMNWNDRGRKGLWHSVTSRKHIFVSGRSLSGLVEVTDREMGNFISSWCYLKNEFCEYSAVWL